MKSTSLDLSIPILNEEKVLEKNLFTLLDYMECHLNSGVVDWQIVVVDNGSTDRSPQIMQQLCNRISRLRFLRTQQIGVGLALKTSWSVSNTDIVGYMDIDLATSLKHVDEMLCAIIDQYYDFVYGSRLHKKSQVTDRSLTQEITSRTFNWLQCRPSVTPVMQFVKEIFRNSTVRTMYVFVKRTTVVAARIAWQNLGLTRRK